MALRQPRAPGTRSQTPANATQQPDAVPWNNQQPEAFPGNPGTVSNAPPTTFPGPEVFGKPETGNRGPTTEGGLPSKVVTSSGSALRRCSCFADSETDPAKLVSSQTWSLANAPEPPQCAGSRQNQSLCTPEASGTLGERSETPGVSGFAPRPLGDSGVRPETLPETRGISGDSQTLGSGSETSWRLGCADHPERSPGDSGTPRDSQRLQFCAETLRDSGLRPTQKDSRRLGSILRLSETRVVPETLRDSGVQPWGRPLGHSVRSRDSESTPSKGPQKDSRRPPGDSECPRVSEKCRERPESQRSLGKENPERLTETRARSDTPGDLGIAERLPETRRI